MRWALTSYRCISYSSKVVIYCEYVLVNPAITTCTLSSNCPWLPLLRTDFTASRSRLPAIVVNSATQDKNYFRECQVLNCKLIDTHCLPWLPYSSPDINTGIMEIKFLPPGTLSITSCPTLRIWIGSTEGCTNQDSCINIMPAKNNWYAVESA